MRIRMIANDYVVTRPPLPICVVCVPVYSRMRSQMTLLDAALNVVKMVGF